ncbi:MAG: glutathione S-transferase [Psychroserpens sp.]|jgi:glutathione S-transferase
MRLVIRLAPESLKQVHPLAKTPIIVDNGISVCESGLIIEYIINHTSDETLRPKIDCGDYF